MRNRFDLPREVWVIITGLCIVAIGTYMVLPFFAIYLAQRLQLSTAEIGIALTVKMLTAQGLTLFSGMAADRFGPKRLMCWGLLLRAASFMAMPFARNLTEVLVAGAVMGAASAMYMPSGKAAVATLVKAKQRVRALALRNTAGNIGVAVGPLVGAWLVKTRPELGFYISAAAALLCYVATILYVPSARRRGRRNPVSLQAMWKLVATPGVWRLGAYTFMFWAVYSQFELTMPLYVEQLIPATGPTLLFSVNALLVILLQLPAASWVERRWAPWDALGVGMGIMGIGIAGMVVSGTRTGLIATMLVFTLGEILISPVMDNLAVVLAPKLAATALGLMGLLGALGSAAGNLVSGPLFDRSVQADLTGAYWYGAALVSALVGLATITRRGQQRGRPQAARPATQ